MGRQLSRLCRSDRDAERLVPSLADGPIANAVGGGVGPPDSLKPLMISLTPTGQQAGVVRDTRCDVHA